VKKLLKFITPAKFLSHAIEVANQLNRKFQLRSWKKNAFDVPAPTLVKRAFLRKFGKTDVWIETGTYYGDTTKFLAKNSNFVYSIEPDKYLAELAELRFAKNTNIKIIQGTSENEFEKILSRLEGEVSIWLDGHYSAGATFKGEQDTPIRQELHVIKKLLDKFSIINVFIDDFRCFDPENPEYKEYPSKQFLVDWAEKCNLKWTVQHDIFYAFKP
jgi:hypothetical protein